MPFLWAVAILCSVIGGWEFLQTMVLAKSAPQQAAGAGMALAWAVIPYVVVRAIDGISEWTWRRDMLSAIARLPAAGASPSPPASTPLGAVAADRREIGALGRCPGCGKLRGQSVPKCVYCGNTEAVKE